MKPAEPDLAEALRGLRARCQGVDLEEVAGILFLAEQALRGELRQDFRMHLLREIERVRESREG